MKWLSKHPGGGVLDADGGFGQAAMAEAMDFAVEALVSQASVVVAVQGSVHYGAGAFWVRKLADHGYIGIVTSTTGPVVSPFGGSGKVLGTNPLSVGLPTSGNQDITLDMATSSGAYGKVIAARNAGQPIPEGWAVDSEGNPTTDAKEAIDGSLTPFGGYKGSGLAVALEGISAALSEANFAYETTDIWVDPSARMNVGHLLMAVNPQYFLGQDHTRDRLAGLQERVRASGDGVFAPGDIEAKNREVAAGVIRLEPSTAEMLERAAEQRGVAPLVRSR